MRKLLAMLGALALLGTPAMAKAITCKDGTASAAKTMRGACSRHGGVAASAASATMSTPPGGVTTAVVATKPARTAKPTKSMTVAENNGSTRSTTTVSQMNGAPMAAPGASAPPAGLIAIKCQDGTTSTARTTRGACSRHGGLASTTTSSTMVAPAGTTRTVSTKPAAGRSATATSANGDTTASATRVTQTTTYPAPAAGSAAGAVSAICRDGTSSYSQHRSGTCSRHGGVKTWMN